jgi:hypothetical protein
VMIITARRTNKRDDQEVYDILLNDNEPILAADERAAHVVCLAQWIDGSYTAFVTHNRLYDLFHEIDSIHDPAHVEKIWVEPWSYQEKMYRRIVDTARDPVLVHVRSCNQGMWKRFEPNE